MKITWIFSAGQPAIRPTKNHIKQQVIASDLRNCCSKDYFLLSHVTLLSSLSIGMRKQLASPQHSMHGVNREANAPALQEYQGVKARLEANSTIQYLVLHTHVVGMPSVKYNINLCHIQCTITNNNDYLND